MAKQEKFGVLIEGKETVSAASKKAQGGLKGLGNTISSLKLKLIGFTAAIYTLVRAISSSVKAYAQQEQAVARLSQALKNQNEFTKHNIKELLDQAKALQKLTVFGDEQIISAQAMLTSFALTTEQIKKMTPRMLDVATMTAKTTGEMMDLEGAAKFVGMALGGQAGRLTQAGIRLSDYQKASFRAANETERFNMLIEIFDQNAAGLAISVGETATGAIDKFKNKLTDLWETVGKDVLRLLTEMTEKSEELGIATGTTLTEGIEISKRELGFLRKEFFKSTKTSGELRAITKELAEEYLHLRDMGLDVGSAFYWATEIIKNQKEEMEELKETTEDTSGAIVELTDKTKLFIKQTQLKLDLLNAENEAQRKAIRANADYETGMIKLTDIIKLGNVSTKQAVELWQQLYDIKKKNQEIDEEMDEAQRARSMGQVGWQEGTGIRRAQETIDPETGESTWS